MVTVNLYDAKTRLSKLVERAVAGEEIAIAKVRRPLARPMPLTRRAGPWPLGLLTGRFSQLLGAEPRGLGPSLRQTAPVALPAK